MAAGSKALVPCLVGMMLLTGVCNTLLTKYQDMQCVRDCDTSRPKTFEQPVIQTLQMFVGESGCWIVVFLGYLYKRFRTGTASNEYERIDQRDRDEDSATPDDDSTMEGNGMTSSQTLIDPTNVVAKPLVDGAELDKERLPLTGWKVTLLALPAICDICGTTLMNAGLLLVAASIYQMTRGALVLFVGLLSVIFLKRRFDVWRWASLVIVVVGVGLVGLAGALDKKHGTPPATHLPGDTIPPDDSHDKELFAHGMLVAREAFKALEASNAAETVLGVFLIAFAQIFTASQFVLEEWIMEKYSMDPIVVVGWEGLFGFSVTFVGMWILHAFIGSTKAGRYGYFDAREGLWQMFHYPAIGYTSILIMISIGGFNFFGLSVTRIISATSRSIIDTCRTLFIWIVSLGLGWETFKWLQVVGFVLLVYGTALFNELVQPPMVRWLRKEKGRRSRRQSRGSTEEG